MAVKIYQSPRLKVEFDKGSFDNWCVFIQDQNKRYAPSDKEYFERLKILGNRHGNEQLIEDFLRIYDQTTSSLSTGTIELIEKLAERYQNDEEEIKKWLLVIYAGMVAEENKTNTRLGKRIKRLGMYQLLILNRSALHASNYSRNRKWWELDDVMKSYGF